MGAVVIEHEFNGKPNEDDMYAWIENAAQEDSDHLREEEIDYYMSEILPEENPGVHEDDLYEMACDRVDMTNDYLIYPGSWAAYSGGCHLINADAANDPEQAFWALADNTPLPSFENTNKWDDNVFYYYDKVTDQTIIKALVAC